LGVSEQAKEEEILAKFEVHKKAFEDYKKAFEVLGDGKKKEEYDRKRAEESKRRNELYRAECEAERKKELEHRKSVLIENLRLLSQGKNVILKIEKNDTWKLAEAGWTLEFKKFWHYWDRDNKYFLWIGNEDGYCFKATVQDEDEERNVKVKKDGARKLITYVSEYCGDLKYRLTITDQKYVNEENVSPDEDTGSKEFWRVWVPSR